MCYLCEGRWWFQCIGYDYTAYMNDMDLAFRCLTKAVRFNHSLTLEFRAWMSNYITQKTLYVIIYPRPSLSWSLNTLRLQQSDSNFPDNILKWIFLKENVRISIKISLKFVPGGPISNIPALVQIMAWCLSSNKPLFEPMMLLFTDVYLHDSASMS